MGISKLLMAMLIALSFSFKTVAQDLVPQSDTVIVEDNNDSHQAHGEVKWGYKNASGNWAVPPVYDYAGPFNEGLAPVGLYEGSWKYGFINEKGEVAIRLMYDVVSKFNEGLAFVAILNIEWQDKPEEKKYHRIGYINPSNEMVITLPAQFCKPSGNCYYVGEPYSGGFAKLKKNDKTCGGFPPLVISRSSEVQVLKE